MQRRAPSAASLIRGAVLAPLLCFGHGSEFILAKLDTSTPGEVRLELTADYGQNPLLTSAEEARGVLPSCLHLLDGGSHTPLEKIATPVFQYPEEQDPTAPLPPDPLSAPGDHQLISAIFCWKTRATAVQFTIPRGSRHDVLLWQADDASARETARWQILLAGDHSSVISLPESRGRWLWPASGVALLLGALALARRRAG